MGRLRSLDPSQAVELVVITTSGDRNRTSQIWEIGGKGAFVKEIQQAVLDCRADLAVHSAKDLPSEPVEGLVLVAVPKRADPRDCLVGSKLVDLPPGARIATGSVRRRAQLAWLRPDLTFAGLRGNIDTRLEKAGEFDAIVMAVAALERLNLGGHATDRLEPTMFIPQVGQGALAVECRSDDEQARRLVGMLDDSAAHRCFEAERSFLRSLGGDCDLPAGAHATELNGEITIDAMLASLDGHVLVADRRVGSDPADLGTELAAHLMERSGGGALLT